MAHPHAFWRALTTRLRSDGFTDEYVEALVREFGGMAPEEFARQHPRDLATALTRALGGPFGVPHLGFLAAPDDAADVLRHARGLLARPTERPDPALEPGPSEAPALVSGEPEAIEARPSHLVPGVESMSNQLATVHFGNWASGYGLSLDERTVRIASVSHSAVTNGTREIVVRGFAPQVTALQVEARAGDGSAQVATHAVDATAFFETALQVPADARLLLVRAGSDDGGAAVSDLVALTIGDGFPAQLPTGSLASLEPERHRFLAGTSDRLVDLRSFSLIVLELQLIKGYSELVVPSASGTPLAIDVDGAFQVLQPKLKEVHARLREGDIDVREYRTLRSELVRKAVREMTKEADEERAATWRKLMGKRGKRTGDEPGAGDSFLAVSGSTAYAFSAPGTPTMATFPPPGVSGSDLVTEEPPFDLSHLGPILLHFTDFEGRVGLLFQDRVRFQPAGLVAGEPLYTLALTPGEEVQLRQSTETKRTRRLEEVRDRESEREASLSSTWTTDISQSLSETSSSQSALNADVGLEPEIPVGEVPIGASIGMGSSVTEADEKSAETTLSLTRERSRQAAARMRALHKTVLEITQEDATAFSTTRTLRNANEQRVATYQFYKLYRRERATLERHGAQLCFRFFLDDPAALTRDRFATQIDKVDPDNPANLTADAPDAVETTRIVKYSPAAEPNQLGRHTRWSTETYQPRANAELPDGSPVPDGYLHQETVVGLHAFTVYSDPPLYSLDEPLDDPYRVRHETALMGAWTSSVQPSLEVVQDPAVGQEAPQGEIRIGFPYSLEWDLFEGEDVISCSQVEVRFISTWAPGGTNWGDFFAARKEERRQLVERLQERGSAEIERFRDAATADYEGIVISRVLSEELLAPISGDLTALRHILDLENVIVESAPFWATETGLEAAGMLRARLQRLPLPLAVDEFMVPALTASQAVVYVPVREGFEADALALLPGVTELDKSRLVSELEAFRGQHFAVQPTTLPRFDEVDAPRPPFGSPAGTDDWQTEWEKPGRAFDVLGHWKELVPTDGVHIEVVLSDTVSSDEHRTESLRRFPPL